ncbi:UPF0450 protein C17orf58 homolog isoform 2-T2 [Anomaloglossus baeobatrachus]
MPLDNNPGLRTADVRHRNDLPAAHRNRPGSILTAPNIHTMVVPQHESNRPGRSPPQAAEGARPAHPRLLRKGGAERTCAAEGHTEGDERQAFCHSDFAVNGIIHDVDAVGGGATILTVLVTTAGLYKGKRLHLTPDTGAFSRVTVLALHRPPCPHLRLGEYCATPEPSPGHRPRPAPPALRPPPTGRPLHYHGTDLPPEGAVTAARAALCQRPVTSWRWIGDEWQELHQKIYQEEGQPGPWGRALQMYLTPPGDVRRWRTGSWGPRSPDVSNTSGTPEEGWPGPGGQALQMYLTPRGPQNMDGQVLTSFSKCT